VSGAAALRAPWTWRRRPLTMPARSPAPGADDRPCLVHIVREVNGLGCLRRFADALRGHPPGIDCELVLAMKGFASAEQVRPYLDEVADLAPQVLYFPDRGFDLGVYFASAARLRRSRYCFVKCHCRPLVDGWLAKLDTALARPGVGQVGATGAWTSLHSWMLYSVGLPSVYRSMLPPPRIGRRQIAGVHAELGASGSPSRARLMWALLKGLRNVPEELLGFAPFPVPHIRMTAFMLTHATLARLRLFAIRTKLDTFALESGRQSTTNQLERMGLSTLVVDRAGAVYEPAQWHRSRTFLQGDQEGLLVADNHTSFYANGDLERRRLLSTCAWGLDADPRPRRADRPPGGAL
jgi:hypothetical protein